MLVWVQVPVPVLYLVEVAKLVDAHDVIVGVAVQRSTYYLHVSLLINRAGSSPALNTKDPVAQLVEQQTPNLL